MQIGELSRISKRGCPKFLPYQAFIDSLVNIPGPALLGLSLGIMIISDLTGSASGGLDSLPYNGYVVTTVRAICSETHRRSYKPIFLVSVILPMIAMILAVVLYSVF
ncbi:hypothetical protein [Alteribacillus sp. YIM 98480]|uniref:hypothetical protein n=1 Tax=Alteribacillus sp. YIM 98480 TaxID=2606599 RepID=UPI0018EEF9AA